MKHTPQDAAPLVLRVDRRRVPTSGNGKNKQEMTEDEFYARCGEILDVPHEGEAFQYRHRTRWNNRRPGRGRYPGRGIVRVFGDTVHIALSNPTHNQIIEGRENAIKALKTLVKERT